MAAVFIAFPWFWQVLLIFMQRMELLLSKTPPGDVKSDVLPMIYRALESDAAQIQELCLSILPGFAGDFFFSRRDKCAVKDVLCFDLVVFPRKTILLEFNLRDFCFPFSLPCLLNNVVEPDFLHLQEKVTNDRAAEFAFPHMGLVISIAEVMT